jgi:hypothetical protein
MENDESRIPKSESNPISARVGCDVQSQRNTAQADAILMRANFWANVLALARCAETSAIAIQLEPGESVKAPLEPRPPQDRLAVASTFTKLSV